MVTLNSSPVRHVSAESNLMIRPNNTDVVTQLVAGGCEHSAGPIAKNKPPGDAQIHVIWQFAIAFNAYAWRGKETRAHPPQCGPIHRHTKGVYGCGPKEIGTAN